ncbi:MAG TPA: hypothetical protein VF146_21920, partial [Bryobacteraceae bacterium]
CGPASVLIQGQGTILNAISVEVRPTSPGVFAVTHADGTLVDSSHPARSSELLVIYAAGLGWGVTSQTSGQTPSGLVALRNDVSALIEGVPAPVLWAGLSPALVGMQQVNIEIPADATSGTATLQLMMNGETGAPYALVVQ